MSPPFSARPSVFKVIFDKSFTLYIILCELLVLSSILLKDNNPTNWIIEVLLQFLSEKNLKCGLLGGSQKHPQWVNTNLYIVLQTCLLVICR